MRDLYKDAEYWQWSTNKKNTCTDNSCCCY